VGMQTSATIKESSLGIPQKAEERTAKWANGSAPGHIFKLPKSEYNSNWCLSYCLQ
jgi:hypothetical protein